MKTQTLTIDDLRQYVPSAFATHAEENVSNQYQFLPTSIVIEKMFREGWVATRAQEQRVRLESRENFQKHMIRFCRTEDAEKFAAHIQPGVHTFLQPSRPDLIRPEIVMFNSHDRTSAYKLEFGLFRLACCNGLIVCDSSFGSISVIHKGFEPEKVIDASFELIGQAPLVMQKVEDWQGFQLNQDQQRALAIGAHTFRWDNPDKAPVMPEKLLQARRTSDQGQDLWRTVNRIQENITKGGQREYGRRVGNIRSPKVRAIKGLDEDTKLNKAIWAMAQALREGKIN